MNQEQLIYYTNKLAFEMDSSDLYAALEQNSNIVIVDGRSEEAYAAEHIPGAVNLPHRTISSDGTKDFDKHMIYVCYCDGIGCNASTKTALKLLTLDFAVKELIGGLDWWKRDGYDTEGNKSKVGENIACGC